MPFSRFARGTGLLAVILLCVNWGQARSEVVPFVPAPAPPAPEDLFSVEAEDVPQYEESPANADAEAPSAVDEASAPPTANDTNPPQGSATENPTPLGTGAAAAADTSTLGPQRIQQGVPSAARNPTPPPAPWKVNFFDNDFSAYVGKKPYVFGEETKLMPLDLPGEDFDFTLSVGGQIRHRFNDESNRLVPGGPGDNSYQLWRWRQYYDLKNDYVRFYVETIDAQQFGEDLPPTPIDENSFDLLNAFVDFNLIDDDDLGQGTFRYGRQELLYGKQRLLSPLDWSNTRRNFEGFKYFHTGDGWRFDAFAVNPVNPAARAGIGQAEFDNSPDEPLRQRTLYGGYLTMTANPKMSMDLYTLYQDDDIPQPNRADGDRGLSGARVYGVLPTDASKKPAGAWDYDLEGGYQWGSNFGQRVVAGFATGELGYTWKNQTWTPRLAGLVYYGSGDNRIGGDNNTFYTYYPLGHAYWGIIDNLSGQNLLDYSVQGGINPTKAFNLIGAYHYFQKADGSDFIYNVAQVPVGPRNTSRDIGNEVDIVGTYTFNPNFNVQAGYAYFWYGNAVTQNLPRDDAEFFYLQTTFNY